MDPKWKFLGIAGDFPLPRRAVVSNGVLMERKACRDSPECEVLSKVCAELQLEAGLRVVPRATDALVQECLETNSPRAWAGLKDDIDTKDACADAVSKVASVVDVPHLLITCMETPRDALHATHVLLCTEWILNAMDHVGVSRYGDILAPKIEGLSRTIDRVAYNLPHDRKAAYYDTVSKVIRLSVAQVADILETNPGLVGFMVHAPVGDVVAARPALVSVILQHAWTIRRTERQHAFVFLAKALQDAADLVHPDEVEALVADTLEDHVVDVKLAMAACVLLETLGVSGLVAGLSSVVVSLSSELIKVSTNRRNQVA